MTTIIGLCGSLRRGSFNLMLLHAAADAAPAGTSIEIESIREIPLYDGDFEAEHGSPPSVDRLKRRIAGADGVLIVSPEQRLDARRIEERDRLAVASSVRHWAGVPSTPGRAHGRHPGSGRDGFVSSRLAASAP
jgi:hypothetical protein